MLYLFITALYTSVTIYNSYIYIWQLVNNKKGLVINKQLMDVVSYYINASLPYGFIEIAISGIGYIIYKNGQNLKIYEKNSEDNQVERHITIRKARRFTFL